MTGNTKQNETPQNAAKQSKSEVKVSEGKATTVKGNDDFDNMGDSEKSTVAMTEQEWADFGTAMAKKVPAAGTMAPEAAAALMKKVYNLFPKLPQARVKAALATYFVLNDPSVRTDWSGSPPLVCDGESVPITRIVGPDGFISLSDGTGQLRHFLSATVEDQVPKVITHVPTVGPELNRRLAERGMPEAPPISAVSWVRGVTSMTLSGVSARALYKTRAIGEQKGGDEFVAPIEASMSQAAAPPAKQFY